MMFIEFFQRQYCNYLSSLALCVLLSLTASSVTSQNKIASILGYPADSKLLIIHADDLGVSHSENMASFEAIEKGVVNSQV